MASFRVVSNASEMEDALSFFMAYLDSMGLVTAT